MKSKSFIAFVIMCSLLTACGNKPQAETPVAETLPAREYEAEVSSIGFEDSDTAVTEEMTKLGVISAGDITINYDPAKFRGDASFGDRIDLFYYGKPTQNPVYVAAYIENADPASKADALSQRFEDTGTHEGKEIAGIPCECIEDRVDYTEEMGVSDPFTSITYYYVGDYKGSSFIVEVGSYYQEGGNDTIEEVNEDIEALLNGIQLID